jgi:PKD repeat protein
VFADSTNTGNYFAYNLSSGTGNVSYLWNFGDGTSSTQQYPFHQYAVPGQYVICLTVTATSGTTTCTDMSCDSSSVQRMAAGFLMSQVNVIPQATTGIKQAEVLTGLNAYPNPMADELTIEATTKDNSKLNYVLIDALGRVVLTGTIENSKAIINTSSLEKGFYSLSITNEKGSSLKAVKLVK